MKIKTLWSMDNAKLDRKANAFLDQDGIDVVDVRYDSTLFSFSLMIIYQETEPRH